MGSSRRKFSVHADLLCKHSVYFKNLIQKVRKDIEGECVICHETLDAAGADLIYCKTCGNNLHEHCLGKWYKTKPTCPTCRTKWVAPLEFLCMNLEDLSADGFDMYIQWLYGSSLPTYDADEGDDELRCIRLINAHIVGDVVEDSEFAKAVRQKIVKCSLNMTDASRHKLLLPVYENTNGPCILRKCFIDLCMLQNIHTATEWEETPKEIRKDFRLRLRERTMARNDEEVLSFMSYEGYIEQDEADDDEVDDTTGDESLDS